jgi:spore germination protein GerM
MIWQKYRSSQEVLVTPPQQQSEARRSAILFFATDNSQLARESRSIDPCDAPNTCLKSVLEELLNGPVGELEETIPEGTTVEAVRVEGNLATIELNRTFSESILSGSSAEILAVYSIVNTVAINFANVQKVKLNVDGNTASVLGHLDLSEPLTPDYSLEGIYSSRP